MQPFLIQHLQFMACVAVATYAQNLTGFALALVLLGLVSLLDIVPLPQAANAATILTLFTTLAYFRMRTVTPPWQLLRPTFAGIALGVVLTVPLLHLLSTEFERQLHLLLGACIVLCAFSFLARRTVAPAVSGPLSFGAAGLLSGVLGGLFSSPGPPLVYHLYRQPLELETVRQALMLAFAFAAVVRLSMVVAVGAIDLQPLSFALAGAPVVYGVTRLNFRHPPRFSVRTVRTVVAMLLMLAGVSMMLAHLKP